MIDYSFDDIPRVNEWEGGRNVLVLSNCFTNKADEGCLKVANSLVKRIKAADKGVRVISFERKSELTDKHLKLNKFLVNRSLIKEIRANRDTVLYIPFPAKVMSMAIRTCILSFFAGRKLYVLFSMTGEYTALTKMLLRLSGAHILALSESAAQYYMDFVGESRVTYLKTGVDTKRFVPVTPEKACELKSKYAIDPSKKTILHVGHLKKGRNIAQLMKLDPRYQILLVVSTLTKAEQDSGLRRQLEGCPNIRIIDSYVPDIQEIYQLADAYFFPVTDQSNCIEVPLSVLEAAACGKPVVTTSFGELKCLEGKEGFFFIKSFEGGQLNALTQQALDYTGGNVREAVLPYDWDNAVRIIKNLG